MSREARTGLALLGVAAVLGVVGDVLFQGRSLGVNVLAFAVCFVCALAVLLRVARAPMHQGRRWMALPLLAFAGMFVWRESELLTAANFIAIAGAVTMGALRRTRTPVDAEVGDYAAAAASAGAGALAGGLLLLGRDVPWQETRSFVRSPRLRTAVRGIALGAPLVALFGGLFIAADSIFEQFAASAVPDLSGIGTRIAFVVLVGWLAAGLLRDLVAARGDGRALTVRRSFGAGEIAIALAALDLLFAAFVVVQSRYLFGGASLVESRTHLTYAQYARHGFFELVAVSVLVLPVVLAANALCRERVRLIRALSAALILLELVVAASALQRLRLYERQFGLTELRLYAIGVVVWLALVFVWMLATTLRGRRRFAVGALVLGFAVTAAVNVLNPDALIARTNLTRPHVDAAYLAGLGDDAVPALVAGLPSLHPAARVELARLLLARPVGKNGWVDWSLSRRRAAHALAVHRAQLLAFSRSR